MDLDELRVLLSVAESGSVQAAARALALPRSQLRRRLDALEAEVGVSLLHRDPAGVRLTAAGRVLVERGRELIESTRSLVADARAAAQEAAGTLHVVEPIGMPVNLRAQALLATHAALPRVQIVARQVADPAAHLGDPCDLVLHDGPPPDRSAWYSRVIARVPMRAMASPDYLRARGTPQNLAELAGHDTLGWERARTPATQWPLLAGGHVDVSPWYACHDLPVLQALAVQGGGILFAPYVLFDGLSVDLLTPVLSDVIGAELVFRLSNRAPTSADPKTRSALEQIERALVGFPGA